MSEASIMQKQNYFAKKMNAFDVQGIRLLAKDLFANKWAHPIYEVLICAKKQILCKKTNASDVRGVHLLAKI